MRVLIITPEYPPYLSGVGDYTALLTAALAESGAEVTVLTSRFQGARRANVSEDTMIVRRLMNEWGWGSLPHLTAIAAYGRYDLVHIQYQNAMWDRSASITALPILLRLLGLPVVITIHDYGTPWPKRLRLRLLAGPYGKAWFAVMLWAATRLILTNEQDEHRFLRQRLRYPVPAQRYTIIPIASNLLANPQDYEGPVRFGEDESEIVVGYFGFVNPAKGVDTLLAAFAKAHRRCALHLRLICDLRSDETYHASLLKTIECDGLQPYVTITGQLAVAEVVEQLASCDVVVLPYRDGISLRRTTLMAAMQLGLPIISTHATVAPALLQDGRDVVLVPPDDADALASALVSLATDPTRRAELGRQARARATAFTWPAIAARTLALYRDVLARRVKLIKPYA